MESEKVNIVEAQYSSDKSPEVSNESNLCENDGAVSAGNSNSGDVGNVGDTNGGFCKCVESVEESLMRGIVAKSEMNEGSSKFRTEDGNMVVTDWNDASDGLLTVLEADVEANVSLSVSEKDVAVDVSLLGSDVKDEIGVEEILCDVRGGEATQKHGADSVESVGFFQEGVSLLSEVFGPSNGIKHCNNANSEVEHNLKGKTLEPEFAHEGNCSLILENREKSSIHIFGDLSAVEMSENAPVVGDVAQGTAVKKEAHGTAMEMQVGSDVQCSFNIGDLVWVKTKTELWWPGVIWDPSNALTENIESDKKDLILVKYFGNVHFVRCSPSQLKPFLDNLEHMPNQNNSRSFLGAVQKAFHEIGRRVKEKMTCSCFSKESQCLSAQVSAQSNQIFAVSKEKEGVNGVFSASQFEPRSFLASIRNLALFISMPGQIDLVIIQNCLSAFYHSSGHLQLPMRYPLRPTEDIKLKDLDLFKFSRGTDISDISKLESFNELGNLDTESPSAEDGDLSSDKKSENSCMTRERRKSRFLSYPYVNLGEGHKNTPAFSENEAEGPKDGSCQQDKANHPSRQCGASTPMRNCQEKTKRKWSRRAISDESSLSEAEIRNVSSTKMLMYFQTTAVNCYHPVKSKCTNTFRKIVLNFRRFAFMKPEVDRQQYPSQDTLFKVLPGGASYDRQRAVLESSSGMEIFPGNDVGSEGGNLPAPIRSSANVSSKQGGRKKKEKFIASGVTHTPAAISFSTLDNDFQGIEKDAAKALAVPKKRKKKAEVNPRVGLPDLNGNFTNLSNKDMPVMGPESAQGILKPKRRKRKEKVPKSMQADNVVDIPDENRNASKDNPLADKLQGSIPMQNRVAELGLNTNAPLVESTSSPNSTQHVELLNPGAKVECKKRKRKEKILNHPNPNVASSIPDLNGNVPESILFSKDLPEKISVSHGVKPKCERRRNKTSTGMPRTNGVTANYSSKMINHVEALGGVLILHFTPGSPLPSKETLISMFSVFGQLKESTTHTFNDTTVKIVFMRSSDAGMAYRSLERTNPFGPSLAGFRLNYLSSTSRTPEIPDNLQMLPKKSVHKTLASPTVLPHIGYLPDIQSMKRNIDMMTSMLEKAGDNLSPETKAKLESEIQGFLAKISSLVGPSSS